MEPHIVGWDASPRTPQKPCDSTECAYVDTEDALEQMAGTLLLASHVAVDLEHHHWHSFRGVTCLMQVPNGAQRGASHLKCVLQFSDRTSDWLVDTVKLCDKASVHCFVLC